MRQRLLWLRGVTSVAAVLSVLALATHSARAIEPDPPKTLISSEELLGIDTRLLLEAGRGPASKAPKKTRKALVAFYSKRASKLMWIADGALTSKADALIAEIQRAADWGLDPSAFDLAATRLGMSPSRSELAEAEIALWLAALKYADHARGGRIQEPAKQLSSYLDRKPQLIEPAEFLEGMAAAGDQAEYLRGQNPQHEQFLALRKALLKMRSPSSDDPKEEERVRLPARGPLLSLGKTHPDVALLRRRLEVDAEAGVDPEFFDEDVEAAVMEFQAGHGLSRDGVVGNNTRTRLNGGKVTISEDMLLANMEKWRWMPRDLGDFHVIANVPEYRVRVYGGGEVVHEERVIVGKTNKQTPSFSDRMETVVFHPFWGVPNSIKVNELLPSIARGGNALRKNGLRLQYRGREVDPRSVDWSTADIRNFHVYQPPGRSNVLGEVKFMFPNRHQVYMHDTPTKNLFKKQQRTYSHGCVRVRNPLKLAEAILKYDQDWTMSKVQRTVANGPENNSVKINRPLPVHIVYFTAVAQPDGSVKAFPDVYGHEKRIKLALAGRWGEINKGRDHLAPVRVDRSRIVVRKQYQETPLSNFMQQVFGF